MIIKHINATQKQGKEILFTCLDMNGKIINLTALSGSFKIYKSVPQGDDELILTKTPTVTSATEGKCKVNLTDADLTIDCLDYNYILTFTFGTGDNRVLFSGDFIIHGDDKDNRIKQIKESYGLNFDNYIMTDALTYARKELNNSFENVKNDVNSKSTTVKICHNVMDSNFDSVVDENDFTIFQYMRQSPYTVEDLSSHIESVSLTNPMVAYITLDDEYPDTNYTLRVEYKIGSKSHAELKPFIDKLEEWYVFKYLFENLDIYKLQHGMTSKDINGVNVTYDLNGITEFQKKIQNQIAYYKLKILPFTKCQYNNVGVGGLFSNVLIPKSYD
jgi:hypothetical protein